MNWVKVCGMRDAENIRALEQQAKPDLMGFICWEHSPRYVSDVPSYLPKCLRVGIFVNPTLDYVIERSKAFGFSYVQLHGNELPEFCQEVRQQTGLKIIKAFSIDKWTIDDERWTMYEGVADLFLFDTKCKSVGGSGEQFDWGVLQYYKSKTPFLLSGGIGYEDAERLKHWHHPKCIGIDINSRFETAPGVKDVATIAKFIRSLSLTLSKGKGE